MLKCAKDDFLSIVTDLKLFPDVLFLGGGRDKVIAITIEYEPEII